MKSIHSRRNSVAVFATALVALASSATLFAAVPEVTEVTMSQDDWRLVTISYTLAYASAIVTVDIQTNANGSTWASIGGENIQQVTGDVWKRIEPGARTIMWRPDLSWPDHKVADGGARAVVTAWALDNTPDYMVVDISSAAEKNSQRYYPAAEFIPGGILGNPDYRTTSLVMRKIMAKDIQWTMGSVAESGRNASREATHKVTLANNFYIGVFEVTQSQWELITGYNPSYFSTESAMRPVENVCYADIRQGEGTTGGYAAISGGTYPEDPYERSFLGLLRERTGIEDFDLPSDAQWEFAARAGNGEGYWGDGSAISISSSRDSSLDRLGRYLYNPSTNSSTEPAQTISPAEGGTAIAGSYGKNDWGLYDVYGNVWELCLDWFADDITSLNGAVNTTTGSFRVRRGGGWYSDAASCRAANRADGASQQFRRKDFGFRVVCTAGLR